MKYLVDIDLAKNSLNNARVQNLAGDPSSPQKGQVYFNTTGNKFRIYNGTTWDEMGTSSATGDMSASVYDPTSVAGDAFDQDNMADGTTNKNYTATEKNRLAAITDGDYKNTNTTAANVGLNNVDNTSDASKPISSSAQSALNLKATLASPTFTGTPSAPTATGATNTTQVATTAFVKTAVSALVDAAPGALDTLNELAAALGDDADFSTTITNLVSAVDTRVDDIEADGGPTKKYTATVGGSTSITVTHNLGSSDVITQVREASGNAAIECDITNATINTVTLGFNTAPSASSLKVTVIG